MTGLLDPATFDFLAQYFLAGFIVLSVRARFILGTRPKPAEILAEAVILSLINQVIIVFLASLAALFQIDPASLMVVLLGETAADRLAFLFEVVLVPALFGIVLGRNLNREWQHALLRRLSMPVIHPVRRAQDFAFGHEREAGFVIVTYSDGTVVYGYFGPDSLAASDDDRSDLFLERLYDIGKNGEWIEPRPPKSALLSLSGVRSIEFLKQEEPPNGEAHNAG